MFEPVSESLPVNSLAAPLSVFRALSKAFAGAERGAFFFQRSNRGDGDPAPSETVLAVAPFETIRVRQLRATIDNAQGRTELEGNPFEIVSARVRAHQRPSARSEPFFSRGGALGYFAYDSVRTLEPVLCFQAGNLRALGAADRAEVGPEGGYDAEFMLFGRLVVYDHVAGQVRLIAPGAEALAELRALCGAARDPEPEAHPPASSLELPVEKLESMLGKERFLAGVRKLKEHIRAGDIFQAVLSEKFQTPFAGDPLRLFEVLSRLSPSPYQFYFSTGTRVYLGASPELLLRVRDQGLETHPIAGTRPRGATEAEDRRLESQLVRSAKERAEHLMLVDLARNDIGRVSEPGSVRVPSFMQLKKFSGVMHLSSTVTGRLKAGHGALEALASCFPAGTLSGAPKIRAMQLLSELEPRSRGFYGGAVVAADFSGELDSCISIRCVECGGGRATIQAGAGIVADSQPEREYDEVRHKTLMARRALAGVVRA